MHYLPKGSFRLPTGEIAQKIVYTDHRGQRIAIIGVRRAKPDLELLAKAIIASGDRARAALAPRRSTRHRIEGNRKTDPSEIGCAKQLRLASPLHYFVRTLIIRGLKEGARNGVTN
jgi:hypothetical protein